MPRPAVCETPWCVLEPGTHEPDLECMDAEEYHRAEQAHLDHHRRTILDYLVDHPAVDWIGGLLLAAALAYVLAHLLLAVTR